MQGFITIHSQTLAPILSQMISLHIPFFKHTEYTASAYLHTFLRTTATCKSIHALHTALYTEDIQNGTHSRTMWQDQFWWCSNSQRVVTHEEELCWCKVIDGWMHGTSYAKWSKRSLARKVSVIGDHLLSEQELASVMMQLIRAVKKTGMEGGA